MFTNLTAHPGITQAEHRALPFVSNTDLSNLRNEALGLTRTGNPQALTFGVAFHEAVLEPHRYHAPEGLPPAQLRLLDTLAAAVRRQRYCRDLLYRGTPELTHTATHTETGLTIKIRPDLLVVTPRLGRRVLVDFKTTSCRDYAQFVATIEAYDYDRQAALYSDVLGADRFLIVGVQKKAPHDIWLVELSADNYSMEQGRKKYRRLLKLYAEQQQVEQMAAKFAGDPLCEAAAQQAEAEAEEFERRRTEQPAVPLVEQVPTRAWADAYNRI